MPKYSLKAHKIGADELFTGDYLILLPFLKNRNQKLKTKYTNN